MAILRVQAGNLRPGMTLLAHPDRGVIVWIEVKERVWVTFKDWTQLMIPSPNSWHDTTVSMEYEARPEYVPYPW